MPDFKNMLQQLADAYNDRDPDAFAAHWNSDCEWHPVLARPEGDPGYYGHNGIRSWFEDVNEMYEYVKFHVYFDQLREVGDRLLIRGRMNARGRGSGAEVTSGRGMGDRGAWREIPARLGLHELRRCPARRGGGSGLRSGGDR